MLLITNSQVEKRRLGYVQTFNVPTHLIPNLSSFFVINRGEIQLSKSDKPREKVSLIMILIQNKKKYQEYKIYIWSCRDSELLSNFYRDLGSKRFSCTENKS